MKLIELFDQALTEGIYDPSIFKAIIMAGAPGAGKSHVANEITQGHGLRTVNSDDFLKIGLKSHTTRYEKSAKRLEQFIDGRLGVIIDGTGRNLDRIAKTKKILDFHGYETKLVYVDVDIETALARNAARDRKEDETFVRQAHAESRQNIGELQNMFGDNFVYANNEEGTDFTQMWKSIGKWLARPVNTPYAQQWKQEQHASKSGWTI